MSGRWVLGSITVAAAILASGCDGVSAPPGAGPTTAVASSSASAGPACLPKIVDTGFSVTGNVVHYGVVARNDCRDPSYNNTLAARVLGPAGAQIAGQDQDLPDLPVLLPGQEVGSAGSFYLTSATTVGKVEVRFTAGHPAPANAFASWPKSVRVADLTFSKPDAAGRTSVSGRIVTDPAEALLCAPRSSLVVRDAAGHIIYGLQGTTREHLVSFDVAMPATADLSKTTVYVALGQPSLIDNVAYAACQ